jgi:hypothetical protein
MLMHVTVTLDAIKKRGHCKAYNEAQALYVKQKEVVKLAKAGLSLLDGASKGSGKSMKTLNKVKKAKGVTKVPDNPMPTFQADLEKAKSAAKNAKGAMTAAANQMFVFYANLLSVKVKYALKKIIEEQMTDNLYVDLQGISQSEAQEECPTSDLTIVCCSIFTPSFPSTRLSKKSTLSQMYLRSPSTSTYISLYGE